MNAEIANPTGNERRQQAAHKERFPNGIKALNKPIHIQFLGKIQCRGAQYPGAELIGREKKRRYGHRIAYPDQRYGQGYVSPPENSDPGGENHLEGYGHKGPEQTYAEGPGDGMAIKMPKVRIMNKIAEYSQATVGANCCGAWRYFF